MVGQLVAGQEQSQAVVVVLLYLQLLSCQVGDLVLVQLHAKLELVVEMLSLWLYCCWEFDASLLVY